MYGCFDWGAEELDTVALLLQPVQLQPAGCIVYDKYCSFCICCNYCIASMVVFCSPISEMEGISCQVYFISTELLDSCSAIHI